MRFVAAPDTVVRPLKLVTRFAPYIGLLATVLLPEAAIGACLLNDYSVKAEYDRSAGVLTGQVASQQTVSAVGHLFDGVVYTVQVETLYRGSLDRVIQIFSENSSGRFPMQRRVRYVLFVYSDAGHLVVDNCGNSGPVSEKATVLRAVEALVRRERSGQHPNFGMQPTALRAAADAER